MQHIVASKRKRSDDEEEESYSREIFGECDFWNIHRRPMVLECDKGKECIDCSECNLIFCSEFCYQNHVCHSTSLDYDDCVKDPRMMVQWMFERLDAAVVLVFGGTIGTNVSANSSHDLCNLFMTKDQKFTAAALSYWSALKSGPKAFREYLELNCQIGFQSSNNTQQLVFSVRSKFSKFVSDKVCSVIKQAPHLHSVLIQGKAKKAGDKKGRNVCVQENCCLCTTSEEEPPPKSDSDSDDDDSMQVGEVDDDCESSKTTGKKKLPPQLGQDGKPYYNYSIRSRYSIKKAVMSGLKIIGDTVGFSPKRNPNLILDAILDDSEYTLQHDDIKRYRKGLKAILDTYFNYEPKHVSPKEKYRTLSTLVSFDFTFEQIDKLCKELYKSESKKRITRWQWRNARAHFQLFGAAGFEPRSKSRRNAFYKKSDIDFMIKFLYSKKCLHSVAYGTHNVVLSSGKKIRLPSLLRWQTHKCLYQSYKLMCAASSKVLIKRTTFDIAVNTASKMDDKALNALDSVGEKCGTQNFIAWRKLVTAISKNNVDLCNTLSTLVTRTEEFLRNDFKDHLNGDEERTDDVCNHSMSYAFNVPDKDGDHDQDEREFTKTCEKCMLPQLLVESTRHAINELLQINKDDYIRCRDCVFSLKDIGLNRETRKSLHRFLDRREDQLLTLLTHLIRSKHEDATFDKITTQLLFDEVFLILDYKMKLLPMFYRESQASFFGKRGITWLGFLLIRKKTSAELAASGEDSITDYVLSYYDVISDDGKEDGESVINCIASVLKKYKSIEANSHIKKGIAGSDGAAYFSGSDLCIAFASMGAWTGINIIMHVVSEAGQGKSRVDNHFAWMMKQLWSLIIKGRGENDVYDAASACNTLTSDPLGSFTTIGMIDMKRSKGQFNCKSIKGLKNIAQRKYEYDFDTGLCTFVTLHPQSFLPESARMSVIDLQKYLPEIYQSSWPVNVSAPLSELTIVNASENSHIPRNERKFKEFAATKEEICKKAAEKRQKRERQLDSKEKAVAEKLNDVKEGLKRRGLFPCDHLLCSKVCHSMQQLAQHISKEVHTATTSLVISNTSRVMKDAKNFNGRETLSDIIMNMCLAESTNYARLVEAGVSRPVWPSCEKITEFPILDTHFQPTHFVNIMDREPGYAQKHSSKRFGLSAKMLTFVVFCFKQGVKTHENPNPTKLSPEKACTLQALHGTEEGSRKFPDDPYWAANANNESTFVLDELVELGQMKQYFGSSIEKLEATLLGYENKEVAANVGTLVGQLPQAPTRRPKANGVRREQSQKPSTLTMVEKYKTYWREQGIASEDLFTLVELSKMSIENLKADLKAKVPGLIFTHKDNKPVLVLKLYRLRINLNTSDNMNEIDDEDLFRELGEFLDDNVYTGIDLEFDHLSTTFVNDQHDVSLLCENWGGNDFESLYIEDLDAYDAYTEEIENDKGSEEDDDNDDDEDSACGIDDYLNDAFVLDDEDSEEFLMYEELCRDRDETPLPYAFSSSNSNSSSSNSSSSSSSSCSSSSSSISISGGGGGARSR